MSDRSYKRPRVNDSRAPSASRERPRSPERVPVHKRVRREEDDHPANRLPPSLRGRVTLPGEHRGEAGRSSADRERDCAREQASSKGRGLDREKQQPRARQAEHDRPASREAFKYGSRAHSSERVDRHQPNRYDMSSSGLHGGQGGMEGGRGPVSGGSRRARSPAPGDRRQALTGRLPDRSSCSPLRYRPGDSRNRDLGGVRDGRRGDAGRRDGSAKRDEGMGREREHRGDRTSSKTGEQRSRSTTDRERVDGSDRTRHVLGSEQKHDDQARQLASTPRTAGAEVADKWQPPPPLESSPVPEEGEALPTPRAVAAEAEHLQHEGGEQEQGLIDVISPASGGTEAGRSGRISHQPIKFTLQKLPSVTAEDLRPKHSSKYSLTPEMQAASALQQSNDRRPSIEDMTENQPQQQQQQQPQQLHELQQRSTPLSADCSHRERRDRLGNSSRQQMERKPDGSRDRREAQLRQQQQQLQRDGRSANQQDAGSRRREPSRELSQDTSREHSGTGHSSRHQRASDSSRPAASSQSGHKVTSAPETRPATADEVRSTHQAATPAKTAAVDGPSLLQQQQLSPEQRSTVHVTLGPPLSRADVGYAVPGVLPGQSAMCAEGRAKTAAVHDRQAALVALQLRGLPFSKQLCFKETWQQLVKATRTHPDALDSDRLALHRRAIAAKAVSSRACRHLLAPLRPLRSLIAGPGEEAHIKHLQAVIISYAEGTAANCVQLADGGSMLLPAELKGVLW